MKSINQILGRLSPCATMLMLSNSHIDNNISSRIANYVSSRIASKISSRIASNISSRIDNNISSHKASNTIGYASRIASNTLRYASACMLSIQRGLRSLVTIMSHLEMPHSLCVLRSTSRALFVLRIRQSLFSSSYLLSFSVKVIKPLFNRYSYYANNTHYVFMSVLAMRVLEDAHPQQVFHVPSSYLPTGIPIGAMSIGLGLILFVIGVLGIVINRKNIILMLMSIELMLLAINFLFILSSVLLDSMIGQVFALYILVVAAAESAIGLSLLVAYYRARGSIAVKYINLLRG